ncbi:MAG: hypothetical protein ACE5IY_14655 [bacterium]
MFRITKVFENDLTVLFKIEGKVTDTCEPAWKRELRTLTRSHPKQIIVDLCELAFLTNRAVQNLTEQISDNFYLLNCPTMLSNSLSASGLSAQILGS